MVEPLTIREAIPEEAGSLSALAMRSKAHWGYSPEFMASCEDELTVDGSRIRNDDYLVWAIEKGDDVVGFYALEPVTSIHYELAALFVEPKHIGSGAGRALLSHALALLSRLGATRLTIQGDPNAVGFYLAAGARQIGEQMSGSIPGRSLPLFEIDIRSVDS